MTKASLHFLVLVFATLLASLDSFGQVSTQDRRRPPQVGQPIPSQISQQTLRQQLMRNLRPFEELKLSDLLRLSYQEEFEMELVSLGLMAQLQGQGQGMIELLQNGRPLASDIIKRNLKEARLLIPARTPMQGLTIRASSDVFIDSIVAEVIISARPVPPPHTGPGQWERPVQPNSLISIPLNQVVRGHAQIPLDQLARQQGISLQGAQIERVVVMGQPSMYGRTASVQIELNRRPVGVVKYLMPGDRTTPLPIPSLEEVRSGLSLLVLGDAQISEVRIRVGMVRPQSPPTQRVLVGQEISYGLPLELSRLLGWESRLIRSVSIEARSLRQFQSQIALLSRFGELQGVIQIQSGAVRGTINLSRPLSPQELRLESMSPIIIDALEIEFLGL